MWSSFVKRLQNKLTDSTWPSKNMAPAVKHCMFDSVSAVTKTDVRAYDFVDMWFSWRGYVGGEESETCGHTLRAAN